MRIIEAGHYYLAKGPTQWSLIGWQIMEKMRAEGDQTMLFIDDIHDLADVSPHEIDLPNVEFSPACDHLVMESAVESQAREALEALKCFPGKRAARQNGEGRWFCSGFPITNLEGYPTCVLLDVGLTLLKQSLGFQAAMNILPYFYEGEQKKLLRLVVKALPEFHLSIILFDFQGRSWNLDHHR